jgi:TonB family protein
MHPLAICWAKRTRAMIPEKDLRKELKRCKKCLVFSGADVTMQLQCGIQSHRIRMDILDRDMFDPAPKTPQHTSWTVALLGRLDQAVGKTVMERPAFFIYESQGQPTNNARSSALTEDLSRGKFDAIFRTAAQRPSDVFHEAQNPPPSPTVELLSSAPLAPMSYEVPKYPPIARMARIAGQVTFTITVTQDGTIANLKFLQGHVLLRKAVESAVSTWKFAHEAAGQEIRAAVDFKTNCPPAHP